MLVTLTARAVRSAMTKNTVVVVASAPCFPHGVVDDVDGIAKVHTDICSSTEYHSPGSSAEGMRLMGLEC